LDDFVSNLNLRLAYSSFTDISTGCAESYESSGTYYNGLTNVEEYMDLYDLTASPAEYDDTM